MKQQSTFDQGPPQGGPWFVYKQTIKQADGHHGESIMRSSTIKLILLGLWLVATAPLRADIPFFWLDKPAGRTNPNDPNSPLFKRTSTPVPAPTAPAGTATFSPTRTASPTPVNTSTFTRTNTPLATATDTPNPAFSSTFTPTLTNSPVPSSTATPTYSFTASPTPSASPTMGACPVFCPGCIKYEDFENPVVGDYEYHDTGASAAVTSTTSAEAHSCLSSLAAVLNTGTGNYAAVGFGSNFYVSNTVDATGANYLNLWIKGASAVTFAVSFSEYRGVGDPSDEGWTSPTQSYTSAGNWQQFHIQLSSFTENIYNNACKPNCLTTNNNSIDLPLIGAMDINFNQTGYSGTVYIDDVAFDPTAPTPTPTPAVAPVVYNDFEDSAACGSYNYTDGGCTLTNAADPSAAHGGSLAGWLITFDTTTGFVWGAGTGVQGSGCAVIDATGTNNLTFWLKTDKSSGSASSVGYVITLKEATVPVVWPATDVNNESWGSPAQSTSTFGTWQKVSIPLSSFTEKMNNGDCSPNCASTGDGVLGKSVQNSFDINITTSGFAGTMSIDDIQFE